LDVPGRIGQFGANVPREELIMQEDVIGLVPAAGKGIRLGLPYPKELYPIIRNNHYKPIAQFVIQNLTEAGVQHVIFVINETKHQLIGYFGNGQRFGCQISYVVQESRNDQLDSTSPGLAHALDSGYHLIKGKRCFGMADTIMQTGCSTRLRGRTRRRCHPGTVFNRASGEIWNGTHGCGTAGCGDRR
jgi:dTDP-glucose pyrophosphorylase